MNTNIDCEFCFDRVAKFYQYVRLDGWFLAKEQKDKLIKIIIDDDKIINYDYKINLPSPIFKTNAGVEINIFIKNNEFSKNILINFITTKGKVSASLYELASDGYIRCNNSNLESKFVNQFTKGSHVLDIGGRDRSGLDRSSMYREQNVTVLDILKSKNVDVVGDAHELTKYFNKESFDYIMCISVFEHLLMPYKCALEM